jgi:glycosyltransferase involved in cell wall biosynthesis
VSEALRLLVLLPQLPDDPASGAARTVTTIAGLMAAAGHEVEAIATTANEGYRRMDVDAVLAHLGSSASERDGVLRLRRRGVSYTLVDAQGGGIGAAMDANANWYDRLVDDAVRRLRPHVVLTFGGSSREVARQRRLQTGGLPVVFGLYNMRYFRPHFFDHVSAVITPSHFLAAQYRMAIGLESTVLAGPLWPDDVLATKRDPSRLVIVNPTLDKGLLVVLAIVRLLRDHPSVGIDIFLGRDGERDMRHAAFLMGADLDRPGVEVRPTVSSPWPIYERARVVLVPSLFEDPAPRVVAEAFANGATVVGSDRGGIPEMCADAGIVVPVPRSIHPLAFQIVPDAIARPWVDAILGFYQSDAVWRSAVDRGREVARAYLPPAATEAYTNFFERAARDRQPLRRVAGASTQTRAASQLPPVARHS